MGTSTVPDTSSSDSFKTIAVDGHDSVVAESSTDTLTLVEGSNITLTTEGKTITIASTDTNTTYTAGEGGGLTLSGTEFSINESAYVQLDSLSAGSTGTVSSGEIHAASDIVAYSGSDKRLKTNIQPIQDPLTKLQKIGGYTFDWIPNQDIHSHTGNDIGVIAQEIEEVLPEITTTRDNGYKAVKYEKLTAYLIECVKAQQTHIQQLEDRIVKLEKKD